ncbi:MAG: NAD(P)H-hydrate dehydratase [Candidatus Omnitrophica bacterium]|nr:NAD(P)H-hydrate dehydratase [Candidatus Omnitrophota bacterium]MBU4477967.1 NAD(P)H-hydrate dehydratase [Candidatus Omnitrophota bacterium]MCG2704333.1 NAD(P)H-hydrate dehydratase [Candidatus Omnitrophota bacterium]
MKYSIILKIIALLLIQSFVVWDTAWAENGIFPCSDNKARAGTLSPQVCIQLESFRIELKSLMQPRGEFTEISPQISPDTLQNNRLKIGVFVSQFNPLTVSMEEMMEQAKKKYNLDKIILVLTEHPVHRKVAGTTVEQRVEMIKRYIQGKEDYHLMVSKDSFYLDIGKNIKKELPRADIHFVMGMMSFNRMLTWDYSAETVALEELFEDYSFIVSDRENQNIDDFLRFNPQYEKYSGSLSRIALDKQFEDVSSAKARVYVKEGQSIHKLVPHLIEEHIMKNSLYRGFAEWSQGRVALSGEGFKKYLADMLASYEVADGKRKVMELVKKEVRRRLDQGGKVNVASIGCAQAFDLLVLKKEFPDEPNITYMGMDTNPDIIDEAKQVAGDVHFTVQDIVEGDLSDFYGRFDVIMAVNILHEVYSFYGRHRRGDSKEKIDHELGIFYVKKALENIKKLLTPGGNLILYDGAEVSAHEREEEITIRFKNKSTRRKFYRFAREFLPKQIRYKKAFGGLWNNKVTLTRQDFLRFVCEYLYVDEDRWDIEREESWQYFSIEEYVQVLYELGFTVSVDNFTPARQVERWEKDTEIITKGVGFPKIALCLHAALDKENKQEVINAEEAAFLMPELKPDDFKGSRGRVLVAGGAQEYIRAVRLAAKAAMRSGSGMVYGGIMRNLSTAFEKTKLDEVMPLPLPYIYIRDGIWKRIRSLVEYCCRILKAMKAGYYTPSEEEEGIFGPPSADKILEEIKEKKISVLALGSGLKTEKAPAKEMVYKLIKQANIPIVLDAGGLNAVAEKPSILRESAGQIVITPHLGEMERLTGKSKEYIMKHRHDVAREFAASYGVIVVLKGDAANPTLIADPEGNLCLNTAGNPCMATAGMGDVLSGVIASLIGQGLSPYEAASLGVYMHSRAGDLAADEKGPGLIASDVINYLPQVMKELLQKRETAIHRDKKVSIDRNDVKGVAHNYGFHLTRENKIVLPEGYNTKVVILDTKEKGKKVVRGSDWDKKGTIWECEFFDYLRRCDKNVEIPKINSTSKGTPLYIKGEKIFVVYDYESGHLVKLEELSDQNQKNAAAFLAKQHDYTLNNGFRPLKGERITDTIIEFAGIEHRERNLDMAYQALAAKGIENLTNAERLLVDNYPFFKEQITVLQENLKGKYEKLPRCIIHGDFRPENVLYDDEGKVKNVLDWDTARQEVRIYDVVRSLFYDLNKDGMAFNMEELKKWVIHYQQAAEKRGYPLSEAEIRVIPEMLRARFIQQFIWLIRWETMEIVGNDPVKLKFFDNMVKAARVLDEQAWEKFIQELLYRKQVEEVNLHEEPFITSVKEYHAEKINVLIEQAI